MVKVSSKKELWSAIWNKEKEIEIENETFVAEFDKWRVSCLGMLPGSIFGTAIGIGIIVFGQKISYALGWDDLFVFCCAGGGFIVLLSVITLLILLANKNMREFRKYRVRNTADGFGRILTRKDCEND